MKWLVSTILILSCNLCFSQGTSVSFSQIDWQVKDIAANSPDSLARLLTASYTTDLEKVRSIFRWITENISYRVKNYVETRSAASRYREVDPEDTATFLKPLNERVAQHVLNRKMAVCDGYARLFKTLCDHAGIRSEIVTGYARESIDRVGAKFRSNHNWNAVYIDSAWHLLDVTWASGYINFRGDEFIRHYDNYYFLTPPKDFIRDHYPEDLEWTLLQNPPVLKEFQYGPLKYSGFVKNMIRSYKATKGILEAAIGDTLHFSLEVAYPQPTMVVTDTAFVTLDLLDHETVPVNPGAVVIGKNVYCSYVVTKPVDWLYVVYNGTVVLRYKLQVKQNEPLILENPAPASGPLHPID